MIIIVRSLTDVSIIALVKLSLLNNTRVVLSAVNITTLESHLDGSVMSHVRNNVRYSTDDAHNRGKSQVPHVQAIVYIGQRAV